MYVGFLMLVTVALTWLVPRLLPRWKALRAVPGPALLLWQSVALAGVYAALLLAPLLILQFVARGHHRLPLPGEHLPLLLLGLAVSCFMLLRIALQGHVVGTRLRRERRRQSQLLDLLSAHSTLETAPHRQVRVIDGQAPAAYCIPGRNQRLVLTASTIEKLPAKELEAVVAHEQAHLSQRHDLIIEFFTVLHTAVPEPIRSGAGMTEARLLVERLADLRAVREVGAVPLARALYTLAQSDRADGHVPAAAPARLMLLADDRPHHGTAALALLLSVGVLLLPGALSVLVLLRWAGYLP